jgi:hypothetical protein
MIHPLRLYAGGLRKAHDLAQPGVHPVARLQDGTAMRLPLGRYLGCADATDDLLLSEVRGPSSMSAADRAGICTRLPTAGCSRWASTSCQ